MSLENYPQCFGAKGDKSEIERLRAELTAANNKIGELKMQAAQRGEFIYGLLDDIKKGNQRCAELADALKDAENTLDTIERGEVGVGG